MDLALTLAIAAIIAGAVAGALVRTWSIHRRLYSLEDRLLVVEGVTQREVKIRASQERWQRPNKDDALVAALSAAKVPPNTPPLPWWKNPNLKQGGYP